MKKNCKKTCNLCWASTINLSWVQGNKSSLSKLINYLSAGSIAELKRRILTDITSVVYMTVSSDHLLYWPTYIQQPWPVSSWDSFLERPGKFSGQLGRVVWSWVKITQGKCKILNLDMKALIKRQFSLILFANNLMIGWYNRKKNHLHWKKAFERKKKKPGSIFNPG